MLTSDIRETNKKTLREQGNSWIAHLRYAYHYLQSLLKATNDYHGRGKYAANVIVQLRQDWGQIEKAQAWTAASVEQDDVVANLCIQFASDSIFIIDSHYRTFLM